MPYYSFGLGVVLLISSVIMGGILVLAPGSIRLQRPECGWVGWAFNILSLLTFFILVPVSSVLMILNLELPLLLFLHIPQEGLRMGLEIAGVSIFLLGASLLLWSRLSLRRSFRLAGVKPDSSDYLTMHGPYKLIRHPMYLAALLILAGLTLILSSMLIAIMLIIMLFLIISLIPEEEKQLDQAYPIAYAEYCRRVPGAMLPMD